MAINIPIISSYDGRGVEKAMRDFKKLKTGSDKAAFGLLNADAAVRRGVGAFAKFAAIGAGTAAVLGKTLVSAASNLQESISKVGAVFGETRDEVINWSKTTSKNLGISQQAALEAAGTYGNLFQAFGLGADESKDMSIRLVELAADMASFNNVPVDDALLALRSGLSGETEPLKRFGVALNDVTLKEEALRLGLVTTTKGVLPQAIKTQAAYSLILKQTSLQQGDVERTSDGIAFKMKSVGAQFEDVKAKLGDALLPVFTRFVSFIQDRVLPTLTTFSDVLGKEGVGAAFRFLGGEILGAIGNLGKLGTTIMFAIGLFGALRAATMAFTVATTIAKIANEAFGKSFAVTPIGLIAAGIAAVITVLAVAYVRFEKFRKIVNAVVNFVIGYFERMANTFVAVINFIIDIINKFSGVLGLLGIDIPKIGRIGEVAFGRIGAAAESATEKIIRTADAAEAARFGRIAASIASATKPKTGGGGGGGGDDDNKDALEKARRRFEKFRTTAESVFSQQKSLRDATRDTSRAFTDLGVATSNVARAQDHLNQVVRGYGIGSTQASEAQAALTRAQREATRAGFDLEKSNFAVADAQKALAEARKEGDAQTIREAEIDLAEAQLSVRDAEEAVTDATKAVTDAQTALNEAINGASQESDRYKDALAELKAAQEEELEAIEKVNDAKVREFEITRKLAEAELALAKIKKSLSKKQIAQAEKVVASLGQAPSDLLTGPTAQASAFNFAGLNILDGFSVGNIPLMGSGGIVKRPTLAVIGESGPEAVVPLGSGAVHAGGGTMTINVTVQGTDPQAVVDALRRYVRQNGSLGWVA